MTLTRNECQYVQYQLNVGETSLSQRSRLHLDSTHHAPRPPAIDAQHQHGSHKTQSPRNGEGFDVPAQCGAQATRAESGCSGAELMGGNDPSEHQRSVLPAEDVGCEPDRWRNGCNPVEPVKRGKE